KRRAEIVRHGVREGLQIAIRRLQRRVALGQRLLESLHFGDVGSCRVDQVTSGGCRRIPEKPTVGPICAAIAILESDRRHSFRELLTLGDGLFHVVWMNEVEPRSEEHTSELQSRGHLVCRLLLEKKKRRGSRERDLRR